MKIYLEVITVKKHNLTFLKSKSFYVVLFVAVIAIAAVTVVGLNVGPKDGKNQNLVDLNTPVDVAEDEDTNIGEDSNGATNSTDVATNDTDNTNEDLLAGDYTNDELLEFDVGSYTPEKSTEVADGTTNAPDETVAVEGQNQAAESQVAEEPEQTVSVMQPNVTEDSLKFTQESVITWPVKGNVIMPFSIDNLVHYATLGEWKINPAIVISGEEGTDVVAAVKGVVSSIEFDEETGTTVTMNIGSGYEIVYGQLAEVTCEIGDVVDEGTVIGKIATPTKYYSVEGSNLYFKLLHEGTPVNPMLFLAEEQ